MVHFEHPPHPFLNRIVELYGDMLFDLCASVLWSTSNAQIAFRAVLRALKKSRKANPYVEFERAWVLSVACGVLKTHAHRHGRKLTSSERILLDANLVVDERLKQFDSYFHRLTTEDQLLLLMRDKFGIPYPEIATATGHPEGSLKIRRQQALRALEEWLWDSA